MVSIILAVLKIIGICILAILGLIILICALVLFWPVRYKARGSYAEGVVQASGKVRWLAVSVAFSFQSGQAFRIKARIFGVKVFDSIKERKEKRKRGRRKKESVEVQAAEAADFGKADKEELPWPKAEEYENEASEEKEAVTTGKRQTILEKIRQFIEKLLHIFENIKFTFQKIYVTIGKIRDNITYYRELLQQESTRQAFSLCRTQLARILKALCPRRFKAQLHLGFDDPAVMGGVLAVWGMCYPFHQGKIDILPEFEREIMEGSFSCRGKVRSFVLLWAAWLLLTDSNIKSLRSRLKIR